MKKFSLFIVVLFFGCSSQSLEFNKKYVVVSSFNDVIAETDDKLEAY